MADDGAGLRRTLTALFLFGSVGTGAELLLLDHVEDAWQKAPLVLIGAGWALLAAAAIRPWPGVVRMFQFTMVTFMLSGVIGVGLHLRGNVEFERELQPDAAGMSLAWRALKGATPALAPGTMTLLGALGLTCAHRRRP